MKAIYLILGGAILLLPLLFLSQTIPFQQGWPVYVNGSMTSPIKIADIDNDGEKEVIYQDTSFLGQYDTWMYVKKADGTDETGWPINNAGTPYPTAIFDYNDDGFMEILLAGGGLFLRSHQGPLIWQIPYDGPIFQSTYLANNVSVDDLDNDGIKEIVVTCYSGGAVFVFEPDGSVREGWPVMANNTNSSASIGDIDKDGLKEIIVTSDKIYCFKPDGTNCPGFPFGGETKWGSFSKALLVDFNNDGYLEIIYGNSNALPVMIVALDHNGNLVPPYPIVGIRMMNGQIGNINFDNFLDLIFPRANSPGGLYACNIENFELLPYFPIDLYTDPDGTLYGYDYQNLVDLSNQFGIEILSGGSTTGFVSDGKLFAFHIDGTMVPGFPSERLYHRALNTPCAVDDLDGDGDVEICCGSENGEFVTPSHSNVFCWDSPQPWNRDLADWMMDGFDLQNTGRWRKLYHIDEFQSQIEVEGCGGNDCFLPKDGGLYQVKIKAKRKFRDEYPVGQDVRFSRTIGCGEYEGPVVDNGDGTYTRHLRAPTNECTTTIEGWVNEFKLAECVQIKFVDCLADLGDLNLNGQISSMDAWWVLDGIVSNSLQGMERCRGDVNRNGQITSMDASLILQCTVGLCNNLPDEFKLSCTSHGNCP